MNSKIKNSSRFTVYGSRSKLLIFDLDGTLLLTGGAGIRAINRMFAERYRLENALEGVDGKGVTDLNIFSAVFRQKLGREPRGGELKHLVRVYPRYLEPEVVQSPGYKEMEGVKDFLSLLRRRPGVFLALGTGNIEKGARIKLARARLNRFFPVGGFGTDSLKRSELIKMACRKAGRRYRKKFFPDCVYVIGDTPRDVEAGRACGFKTVAVSCGMFDRKKLMQSKPDFLFEGYQNPKEWLEKLGL